MVLFRKQTRCVPHTLKNKNKIKYKKRKNPAYLGAGCRARFRGSPSHSAPAFPRRSELYKYRFLPPVDCRGSGGDSALGSPGGLRGRQREGVVLGRLQCVRAYAWLALVQLQPSSQEPPASTQRVQTDDCHWLRFEARGILLTEKNLTHPGGGERRGLWRRRGGGRKAEASAFTPPS